MKRNLIGSLLLALLFFGATGLPARHDDKAPRAKATEKSRARMRALAELRRVDMFNFPKSATDVASIANASDDEIVKSTAIDMLKSYTNPPWAGPVRSVSMSSITSIGVKSKVPSVEQKAIRFLAPQLKSWLGWIRADASRYIDEIGQASDSEETINLANAVRKR